MPPEQGQGGGADSRPRAQLRQRLEGEEGWWLSRSLHGLALRGRAGSGEGGERWGQPPIKAGS